MQIFGMMMCAAVSLLGILLLALALSDGRRSMAARSWPTTPGKVLESRLREIRDEDDVAWQAYIVYEYSVNGTTHRSDVWRVRDGASSWTAGARKTIARYPPGSTAMVYFNPAAPADALLEPGRLPWPLIFGGVCFLAGGLIALLHQF